MRHGANKHDGEFHGERVSAAQNALGRTLVTKHRAGSRIPAHNHVMGYVSVCLEGGYLERAPKSDTDFKRGTARIHADGSRHGNEFGRSGGIVLSLQPSAALRELFGIGDAFSFTDCAADLVDSAQLGEPDKADTSMLLLRLCGMLSMRQPQPSGWQVWDDGSHRSIGEMAESAGLRPWAFCKQFRRRHGLTPSQYRLRLKLRQALALAARGPRNWTTIAHAAGFADSAHLIRTCKRFLGCTPGDLFRATAT